MTWWQRWRRLRARGILGMNSRNTSCILDLNPRGLFPLVDNKRAMHDLCKRIDVPTPALYAVLAAQSALRHLPRILSRLNDFVLKPNRGAAGRGVLVVKGRDGEMFVRHNDERLPQRNLRQHVSDILSGLYSLGGNTDETLIQQRVVPDTHLERISFQGTADIRVILYRHEPVMAMLRLPTKLSGGRANLHQGAIGAGIDMDTGRTCHAVLRDRITERHPDTGESVIDFEVPCWRQILDMSQRVSQAVGLGYLGVDIVLDRKQGPLLLEANARPGLAIQIANGHGLAPRLAEIDRSLRKKLKSAVDLADKTGQH